MLAFFAARKDLYGFMLNKENYANWKVGATSMPPELGRKLEDMLRGMGNRNLNGVVSLKSLADAEWRKPAKDVMDLLFKNSTAKIPPETTELIGRARWPTLVLAVCGIADGWTRRSATSDFEDEDPLFAHGFSRDSR